MRVSKQVFSYSFAVVESSLVLFQFLDSSFTVQEAKFSSRTQCNTQVINTEMVFLLTKYSFTVFEQIYLVTFNLL